MAQSETSIHTRLSNGYEVSGSRVLIQPDVKATSKGGFQLSKLSVDQFPTSGTILKVGRASLFQQIKQALFGSGESLKIGDRVIFSRYAGIECTFDDETIVCLPVQDVLMLIDTHSKGEPNA